MFRRRSDALPLASFRLEQDIEPIAEGGKRGLEAACRLLEGNLQLRHNAQHLITELGIAIVEYDSHADLRRDVRFGS